MNSKLYVGNLPYETKKAELDEHFSQAGNIVDSVIITDKNSGRSRGFGFVEYGSEEEAKKAIETLDGKEFMGRELVVKEARPKREG